MIDSRCIPWLVLGLFLGAGVCADEDEPEIHTCLDADGNISFQNDPCPELPKPDPPAPPPEPAASKKKLVQPVHDSVIELRAGNTSWEIAPGRPVPPIRNFGRQVFPTLQDSAGHPASPSFSTPAETWRTFLAAVAAGDGAAIAACLTPAAVESLATVEVEALRRMLETFVRIDSDGDLGPFWSIRGVRRDGHPKWIFIEEVAAGEWKISRI